jgi:hypothetical protein
MKKYTMLVKNTKTYHKIKCEVYAWDYDQAQEKAIANCVDIFPSTTKYDWTIV